MNPRLSPAQHLDWLEANVRSLLSAAASSPDTSVPACPGWTCLDVLGHVMMGFPVYTAFLRMDPGGDPRVQVAAEAAAANKWREGVDEVLGAAEEQFNQFDTIARGLDPSDECLFWDGPGTVGKMFWHAAAESWMHTSDVAQACDRDEILSTDQAADLFEWSVMFRNMIFAGRGFDEAPTVLLEATDTTQRHRLGRDGPAEIVVGTATDLSLRLWNRSTRNPLEGDGPALSSWADVALISPLG